ncbi:MAG: hypothetical protein ACRDD1_17040 [Planctomycetia bacterium]
MQQGFKRAEEVEPFGGGAADEGDALALDELERQLAGRQRWTRRPGLGGEQALVVAGGVGGGRLPRRFPRRVHFRGGVLGNAAVLREQRERRNRERRQHDDGKPLSA